jgi:hypothetical protein
MFCRHRTHSGGQSIYKLKVNNRQVRGQVLSRCKMKSKPCRKNVTEQELKETVKGLKLILYVTKIFCWSVS